MAEMPHVRTYFSAIFHCGVLQIAEMLERKNLILTLSLQRSWSRGGVSDSSSLLAMVCLFQSNTLVAQFKFGRQFF